jgi:hypothetical protein
MQRRSLPVKELYVPVSGLKDLYFEAQYSFHASVPGSSFSFGFTTTAAS